jgi:putative transposase
MRKEINRQIDDMLKADIIEPSEGQFTSAVFLVPKKGKSFRLVVDYRKLNQQTIPENFPMQNITDLLQALGSNHPTIFTTLDMQSGYHQIPIKPAREYTGFITPDNVYQFKRAPFGLTNCPFVFSKSMSKVLQGLVWDIALVYLDDIICFTFEDHIQALRKIFDRLQQANLSLKPS